MDRYLLAASLFALAGAITLNTLTGPAWAQETALEETPLPAKAPLPPKCMVISTAIEFANPAENFMAEQLIAGRDRFISGPSYICAW